MKVKVITDSGSDITQDEARRLGITVVPVYLRFGEEVYRDGVDINCDEFYHKLTTSPIHPSTAAPSPGDFASAYEQAARETNEIVSIHITRKHSATYDAALMGKETAQDKNKRLKIEVVDSKGVTMWQGLVALVAAKTAEAGGSLQQVLAETHQAIKQLRVLALLDTLKYAVRGGRLGKGVLAVESLLHVKPFISLHDGQIRPAGVARTRNKGIERLRDFLKSVRHARDLAIVHSTTPDEALSLADYARSLFPNIVPRVVRLGPALGVHGGPGALVTVVMEGK